MKSFVLGLLGLFVIACNHKQSPEASEQIAVDFDAPAPTRKIEKVVPLETNAESLYGRFFRVRVTDTHIFVQDMQQILIFDANGKYLSKVDRVGHGPQEYISLSHFWPTKDELYVVAGRSEKILVYSFSGQYLRSIDVGFQEDAIAVMEDYIASQSTYNEAGTLVVTDRDGKIRYETIAPILPITTFTISSLFPFTEANGQLYYFPDFASDIYTVGPDSSDVKRIHLDFGPHTVTEEYISTLGDWDDVDPDEQMAADHKVCFPSFFPSNRWWGMTFSLSGKEYTWYYDPATGAQRIASAEGTIAVKPIACATEQGFVASVDAARFLEEPEYAPYREDLDLDENDNAVLIFYTVE